VATEDHIRAGADAAMGYPRFGMIDLLKLLGGLLVGVRIASPEMFPEAEMLPHLICSRPIFIGGANDEADQHGGA
jgi:hypothetical protein